MLDFQEINVDEFRCRNARTHKYPHFLSSLAFIIKKSTCSLDGYPSSKPNLLQNKKALTYRSYMDIRELKKKGPINAA